MTHEEQSLQTKKALAAALKAKMQVKPISRITVSELIVDSDVNRKTFYYHFNDIYALLKWMLEAEAIDVIRQFDLLVDYHDAIAFVLDYIDKNKLMLNCVINSIGRAELNRFFSSDFRAIVRTAIDQEVSRTDLDTPESFKQFLTIIYTEAISGSLVVWLESKETVNRELLENYLSLILEPSLTSALAAEKEKRLSGKFTSDSGKGDET